MMDVAPTTVGEGRRVVALIAGAIVFYVGLAIVSVATDWALSALTNADGTISSTYIVGWVLGAGLASGVGAEAAKLVAPGFNRIGLIVLMVAPVALFAIGAFLEASIFSSHTIAAVLCALLGTAIGLGMTFRDLMQPKKPAL